MLEKTKVEELTENLKSYLGTQYELVRLQATERASVIGSGMVSTLLIALVAILFVLFISLGAGFYLSNRLGDNYSGFVIVAGFYLVTGIVLVAGRKKLVENPVRDKIIRAVFSETGSNAQQDAA